MENLFWILWFVLGAALIVAEVFTSGFVLLWFGVGALAAALAGIIGINNLGIQFMIFALVSIALTAASRTEDRVRALHAGFQIYLAKPVQPAELLAVVAALADISHRR